MNENITVPAGYIRAVNELLQLQQVYFALSAKAKQSKLGVDFQAAKDTLRECKQLEETVRCTTGRYMAQIYGSMTAQDAIAALREQVDGDLESARKEVSNG